MSEASLALRSINDLLTERFFVPSYQRGYRWTKQQVIDLLDDIWEFRAACETKREFYCLQPLVVKRRGTDEWELVDGQQRLTTILLILTCRSELIRHMRKPTFTLSFETRPKSGEFLKKIDLAQRGANVDYFHICEAYQAIESWFSHGDGSRDLQLLQCLTNNDDIGKNVKVIWYELPASEDPVDAFTRLNVGKIPLTNPELIRALFLRSRNFDGHSKHVHQIKIAQEWDAIEKALQSQEMWHFLTAGTTSPPSRIEFIFELIAREQGHPAADDPYATFHFYNERLAMENATADTEWLAVKQTFMTLDEWFSDRILFHLIGYLIHDNYRIGELRKIASGSSKSTFRRALRQTIFRRLTEVAPPANGTFEEYRLEIDSFVSDLDYESDGSKIRPLLLLFNIATILLNPKSSLRFPFHHFKTARWDIEHVRSVQSLKPELESQCRDWLRDLVTYLGDENENKELYLRSRQLLASESFRTEEFDSLYNEVLKQFQEPVEGDADHGIGNLVLLDEGTNRSYKNAVFPVKRNRIVGLDRTGTFVPLCTKNVFLKCYSREIGRMMFWGKSDRDAYRDEIVKTLSRFFSEDLAR